MFKKLSLVAAAAAMAGTALIPTAAVAQSRYEYQNHRGQYQGYRADRGYRGDRGYRPAPRYNGRARAEQCRDGDGGMAIGAIVGGLAGNSVAGYGDKTLGTIIGGAIGALAGREIDRADRPGYCRR